MKTAIVLFWLAAVIGWVVNLVQLANMLPDKFSDIATLAVLKLIGVFVAPLGAILGWLHLFS